MFIFTAETLRTQSENSIAASLQVINLTACFESIRNYFAV